MKSALQNYMFLRAGEYFMAKYVLCPRCELNYMQDGEEYCDVCKAELKMGPQLIFTDDEDEAAGEKLCPICKRNMIGEDEDMCEQCRDSRKYDSEPDDVDVESDDEWRNYLDDDEKDMPEDDGVISFSQLADEEKSDERFKDDEEEAYDNLPESLQFGDRGEAMSEAIDNLESAISGIEEAADYLRDAMGGGD